MTESCIIRKILKLNFSLALFIELVKCTVYVLYKLDNIYYYSFSIIIVIGNYL